MIGSWQFTPQALLPLAAALAALLAAAKVHGHRRKPAAFWLLLMLLAAAWWSFMTALEYSATALAAKELWSQLSYLGIELAPLSAVCFASAYTGGGSPTERRWFRPVAGFAAFMVAAVFTNNWHQLVWPATRLIEVDGYIHAWYDRGSLFWLNVAYCYGAMAWSSAVFFQYARASRGVLRRQGIVLLGATLTPWLTSALYMLRLGSWGKMDHTPVGFAVTGLLLTWGIWRARLLQIRPAAAQSLFDHMADPVLVLDESGHLILANPAARRQFALQRSADDLKAANLLAGRPALLAALALPAPKQIVADGATWWDIQATPLEGTGHRLFVLRDVTEHQRAILDAKSARQEADASASEARAANAAKSSFLAQISHDLRTPLHAIIGISELLREENSITEARASAETIHEAGNALLRLVNDLLDLSQIEAGKLKLVHEPFGLAAILDPVHRLLSVVAQEKGVALRLELRPGTPGRWLGDPDRLRQILLNLVGNAVKFTDAGAVRLCVSAGPGGLHLEVHDTGPGIPEDRLKSIFEPFARGDLAQARRTQGTGLGLAIVHRLVEAMRGTISVRSTPGQGSCFTADLPLSPAPDAATAGDNASPAAGAAPRTFASLHVLLADDDPVSRRVSTMQLKKCGCTVRSVDNGHAVLHALTAATCDVVVLDGQMPGLDGWHVAARIRDQAPAGPRPYLIALSADLSPGTLRRWQDAGVGCFIPKPAHLEDIRQALLRASARN